MTDTLQMEELEQITTAVRLQGVLPELENVINSIEDAAERKIFKLLTDGKLTPELALYAWQEKLILRKLLGRFQTKIAIGTSLGEQHQSELS